MWWISSSYSKGRTSRLTLYLCSYVSDTVDQPILYPSSLEKGVVKPWNGYGLLRPDAEQHFTMAMCSSPSACVPFCSTGLFVRLMCPLPAAYSHYSRTMAVMSYCDHVQLALHSLYWLSMKLWILHTALNELMLVTFKTSFSIHHLMGFVTFRAPSG